MRWLIARAVARAFLGLDVRPGAPQRPGKQTFRADSSDPAAFRAAVLGMRK